MSEAKNKFDFKNIINDIKSMINPTGNTPTPDPEDEIGIKLAELSVKFQQLQENYAEQGKKLAEVNVLVNEVYHQLEAFRQKPEETDKPEEENQEKA